MPTTRQSKNSKHHKFTKAMGEFDELFVRNAFVHIERMNDTGFWIGIDLPKSSGLPRIMINTGVHQGVWFFNLSEDSMDGQTVTVQRPRSSKHLPVATPERHKTEKS